MSGWWMFAIIGLVGGLSSGLFGIGGGVVIVPSLIYFAGFSQHKATGTSLAVLLPPIGIAAVLEYHRHGHVDFHAAIFIAITMVLGSWAGAHFAHALNAAQLRLGFGIFMCALGAYIVYNASKHLGWL